MKLIYCTLFDSNYLSRGLVMYDSLQKHCIDFHLYVFAFDDTCFDILSKLNLPNLTPISLLAYEDAELLSVKPNRTRAEYCWTNTPSTVWYVLNHFDVEHCTYLDADMLFYSNPLPLYIEMGEKSVLITDHRFSNRNELETKAGIYNVQYVTFKNNKQGREACLWWRNACIEWCFDLFEDGKFGDQKYLDDWPTRFPTTHVLINEGGGLATWNIQQYSISQHDSIQVSNRKTRKSFQAIFYHFHALKFYADDIIFFTPDYLEQTALSVFYFPYVQLLLQKEQWLFNINPAYANLGIKKEAPARPLSARDKAYLYRKGISQLLAKFQFGKAAKKYTELRDKFTRHHYYYIGSLSR